MSINPLAPETREFISQLTQSQLALVNYIRALMPWAPNEVDDILQETNLTIWDKMKDFEPGTNFKAWAFTIARYKVMDHLKATKNPRLVYFDNELLDEIGAASLARSEQSLDSRFRALDVCLRSISDKQRSLLVARYGSGTSIEQYASRAGRSASSYYVTLNRIRAKLRDCIRKRVLLEGGLS